MEDDDEIINFGSAPIPATVVKRSYYRQMAVAIMRQAKYKQGIPCPPNRNHECIRAGVNPTLVRDGFSTVHIRGDGNGNFVLFAEYVGVRR